MRFLPEDARRWLAAVGLLAGPAASVLALPRPRQPTDAASRRSRPPRTREDILSELDGNAVELRRYTGASSPSLLSSLLSALWAVGHTQASADAASSIIASASQARIFHLGPSLQRLATYSAAANALAS